MAVLFLCVRSNPTSRLPISGSDRPTCSVGDFTALAVLYNATSYLDGLIRPEALELPHPFLYCAAKFSLWAIYTFWAGLVGTGLWIIAHECGHQAFSESKFLNNTVGWVLHSGWVSASLYPTSMTLTCVVQVGCSVPLLAYLPCKTSRLYRSFDTRPSLCSPRSRIFKPSRVRHHQRGSSGWQCG